MRILKVKKGFITNSSGSYEWIPPVDNSPSDFTPTAAPAPAPISKQIPKSSSVSSNVSSTANRTDTQNNSLDPSVIMLGALLFVIIVFIIAAETARSALRIIRIVKK
jgi:hypothetical protein